MGFDRVGETIERLFQLGLEFSDDSYDSVNSLPVQQTTWPPYKQTNVFVKLYVRRQFHVVVRETFVVMVWFTY
jgi:hypothetical protein